jgi:hypothetical protein
MKSVTVRLDDETFAKTRAMAADMNMSIARYIAEKLGRDARHDDEYEAAYRAWLRRKPFPLKGAHQPYPKREELYDRAAIRREDEEDRKKKAT